MSNIFNLFGDSTVGKAPIFGSVGSNSGLKLKNIGAPGATPSKVFGQKSKGLSIRSTSDLNIRPSTPRSFGVKKDGAQPEKSFLKPKDVFGKSSSSIKHKSPTKQKSPNKLMSPKRLFETSNPAPILLSPNAKTQIKEKSDEIVFKKPRTPQKTKQLDMDIPDLAPIGDIDIELYDLTNQNFIKLFNNKYFLVDNDEGFLSDAEPVPVTVDKIPTAQNVPKLIEIPVPEVSDCEDTAD